MKVAELIGLLGEAYSHYPDAEVWVAADDLGDRIGVEQVVTVAYGTEADVLLCEQELAGKPIR